MLPLKNYSKRGPYDELSTPGTALKYLVQFVPKDLIVWEPCPGKLRLVAHLINNGYFVRWRDLDALKWEPIRWDIAITNPPFSKKHLFLERFDGLKKPYALLLPVTTLGVKRCQPYLKESEIIFLPKRIDFTGKKAPWFAVAWFTKGLNIGKQMIFMEDYSDKEKLYR